MSTTNTAPAPTPTAEKFLTQSQVYAGIRYAGTIVASGGSVVALLGILPPDTAHSLVAALQKARSSPASSGRSRPSG